MIRDEPSTRESARDGATASVAARAAVDAAELAFPAWSATEPRERQEVLERASALLIEREPALASLVTEETGATVGWGSFNVHLGAGMLAYAAGQAAAIREEEE